jgi:pSer/pThr/pTyr-binding forkhead associated (FHA) protein
MLGQLLPCGGGTPIALGKARVVIGRVGGDVTLPFPTVSSKHCELYWHDGAWHVMDLGSRNGVKVNGVRCQQAVIPPGGVLAIAQLRFQVEYAAGSTVKMPALADREPGNSEVELVLPKRRIDSGRGASPGRERFTLGELIPCGGGEPIALHQMRLLIGRSPSCDITLPFPTVSAKHCELEFKEGFWHVRDLASSNGVRVNGHRFTSKYLKPGEILSIAVHRYEVAYIPMGDEPPPDDNPFALSLMEKAGLARRDATGQVPEFRPKPDEVEQHMKWVIDERNPDQ